MDKEGIEAQVQSAHDHCWHGNGGGKYFDDSEDALDVTDALRSEGYNVETGVSRGSSGNARTYVKINPRH